MIMGKLSSDVSILLIAAFYASVSASFTIEQAGIPTISSSDVQGPALWNDDLPERRLQALRARHGR
jgi:hypothetical protein